MKALSQETPGVRLHPPTVTETEVKVMYGVWGLILGAAGAVIVAFNWGGWTTLGASQERTEAAVLTARAEICVAQFTKDPNRQQRLEELKAVSTWDTVARTCVERIGALIEK